MCHKGLKDWHKCGREIVMQVSSWLEHKAVFVTEDNGWCKISCMGTVETTDQVQVTLSSLCLTVRTDDSPVCDIMIHSEMLQKYRQWW